MRTLAARVYDERVSSTSTFNQTGRQKIQSCFATEWSAGCIMDSGRKRNHSKGKAMVQLGVNSGPLHYQSNGRTAGTHGLAMVSDNCGCAITDVPRHTQTVRRSRPLVFLSKVLWSNKVAKSDLRRTYMMLA